MVENQDLEVILAESLTPKEFTQLSLALESEEVQAGFIQRLYGRVLSSIQRCILGGKNNDMLKVIADTKGDFSKHPYFETQGEKPTIATIFTKSNHATVKEMGKQILLISSFLQRHKSDFMKGIHAGCPACLSLYTTFVLNCVVGTSYAIMIESDKKVTPLCKTGVEALEKSAELINSHNAEKVFDKDVQLTEGLGDILMKAVTQINKWKAFTVVGVALLAFFILGKYIVFAIYKSRVKLSDYLAQQALYLQLNAENVKNNSNLSKEEKELILAKQKKTAELLLKYSDKLAIDGVKSTRQAETDNKRDTKAIIEDSKDDAVDVTSKPGEANTGLPLF
jgi:hypothetical protein